MKYSVQEWREMSELERIIARGKAKRIGMDALPCKDPPTLWDFIRNMVFSNR